MRIFADHLKIYFTLLLGIIFSIKSFAQQPQAYPRITGYFSVTNLFGSYNKNGFTGNFGKVYSISFPFGLNLLKSDKFGVSFEISPALRAENNTAKISSVTFHPGAMFRYAHGFTVIGRLAFETNGRFGFTPVFNKVIVRGKDANFFASVPFPVRFGNDSPSSIGTGLQLGVSF